MKLKTRWQHLKYWQKGGIIGFLIWIIYHTIYLFCRGDISCLLIIYPELPFMLIFDKIGYKANFYAIFGSSMFGWSLIAALIGLIIGKVKGKSKTNKKV